MARFKMRMTTNSKELQIQLRRIAGVVQENAETLVPEIAVAIVEDVTADTPVDTGMARSGWNASKSGPDYVRKPAITSESQVVSRARSAMGKKADGAFVSNGVPYIGKLDQGSSQQAPAGFVRAAVVKAVAKLAGVRLLTPGSTKKI